MSLSEEIYLKIFSYLPQHHLRPVLQFTRDQMAVPFGAKEIPSEQTVRTP
jgi:hypothetical protein